MTAATKNPKEINVPSRLQGSERRDFRRVYRLIFANSGGVSSEAGELIADIVTARGRAEKLSMLLATYSHRARAGTDAFATMMALKLAKQVDSTTALAHKIADRLEIEP